MNSSIAPVLVAGAGPSGLVAALTLLQNNIPVRIIDKEPHYRIGQRGSALWPRTFEVFHFLRAHEIHETALPIMPIREYKPRTVEPTKTIIFYPHNDPTPSIPYNNPKALGQPAIEGILRSHLEKYGCFVELGTELQSLEDDGERVIAKLVKTKDGEEISETCEASYVIGADGGKGVTRKQIGLKLLGETRRDVAFVVGDVCMEIEGVDRKHWHFFGDRATSFCTMRAVDRIAHDGFNFMMTIKDYEPARLIADKELLFKCMSELMGQEIKVREIVILSEFRPNIRMVEKFGRGRVFLVGDAAHVHSPTGGQGMNTCIQDALNLSWKLSLVYKGLSPATLLESYTTERLPVISEMLNLTTGMLNNIRQASTIDDAMKRETRMNMLGVNYRSSPIVVDEYTRPEPVDAYGVLNEGVLVAGDRAPDASGLSLVARADGARCETRLFDVFRPMCHTVLVFTPDVSATTGIVEALKRYPEGTLRPVIVLCQGSEGTRSPQADVVVDNDGHAYRVYLTVKGEQKVVVVRPDGVVGAIVRGAEGVGAYLGKIFV